MVRSRPSRRQLRTGRSSRGIALLLTLGILLLLTLLALAFSSSQITESQAARNFHHAARAEEIALGGLESAIAVLREDARENSYDHLFERWAVYYRDDDGFAGQDDPKESADLSDYDEFEYGVDERGITGGVSPPRDPWKDPIRESRWIEVWVKDPATMEPRKAGRYAVCIEDESAKVNINAAGNPDPEGAASWRHRQHMAFTTAEMDLGAIFDSLGEMFRGVLDDVSGYPDNLSNRTALDVVAWRYGRRRGVDRRVPGNQEDDNFTSQMPMYRGQHENGIDDDGDGYVDEPEEEMDEPGEFDPYDPMLFEAQQGKVPEMKAPGQFSSKVGSQAGILGDDTPYLTVSQIRMTKSVSNPPNFSLMEKDYKPPYPKERLYRSVLPFITVYSQDLNRFSNTEIGDSTGRTEWMQRENIADWFDAGPGAVYDFLSRLRQRGIAFTSTSQDTLERIACNIYDLIDPDWIPTWYAGGLGIEPTLYLNEVEPTPPDVPGPQVGLGEEVVVKDYGEFIELWNPYDVPLDAARYNVTIDSSGTPMPVLRMQIATGSTIVRPHRFFLIGDTLGDVVEKQGGSSPNQTPPVPWPPGCDAYAPLKLGAPLDMDLEVRLRQDLVRKVEVHSGIPVGTQYDTAQKDDPRIMSWSSRSPTPRATNPTVPTNVYSYFCFPGVQARARDVSFNPNDPADLMHGGGLSSIGELAMVHRARRWESLNLTGDSEYGNRDDVSLLDLLTLPYGYSLSDPAPAREFVPGRININTAPPEVLLGLNWDIMFDEISSYGVPAGYGLRIAMIDYIVKNRPYRNLADLAEAMAEFPLLRNAPETAREAFLKYNANLVTTRSNVFKVTVLAEALDRRGDAAAVRKLEAIVDRGFTPGSFDRPGEQKPSVADVVRAETPGILYFRWATED